MNPRAPLQARKSAIKTIPTRFISAFLHLWRMGHPEAAVASRHPVSGSLDSHPAPVQARSGCDPRFFAEGDTSLVWSTILPDALKRSAVHVAQSVYRDRNLLSVCNDCFLVVAGKDHRA